MRDYEFTYDYSKLYDLALDTGGVAGCGFDFQAEDFFFQIFRIENKKNYVTKQ